MNHVVLIGNLTREPDLGYTESGKARCVFTIAVNNGKDDTDFIRIVTWNKSAENCGRYLSKGKKVAVQGRIKTGSYKKDGVTHYTTDVWANNVEFLSKVEKKEDDYFNPEDYYESTDEDIPF